MCIKYTNLIIIVKFMTFINYMFYKMKLHIIDSSRLRDLLNRAINRDS